MALSTFKRPASQAPLDPGIYTAEALTDLRQTFAKIRSTNAYNTGFEELKLKAVHWGAAWSMQVPVDSVGVSPWNRGGAGVTGAAAQQHGWQIRQVGFTSKRLEPVSHQRHPESEYEISFNKMQIQLSDHLLPPLRDVVCLSLGCGHTNAWLRQNLAQVRSIVPALANEAGMLDPAMTGLGQPDFATALKGLKWLVFHWQLEDALPGIWEWVQRALNAVASCERGEIEVMKEYWESACSSGWPGSAVDWRLLGDGVVSAQAPCVSYRHVMANFLKAHGGALLPDVQESLNALERLEVVPQMGAEYLQALADCKADEPVPFLVYAGIEAALASHKVVDGFARNIAASKLSPLRGKKEQGTVKAANAILRDGRDLASRLQITGTSAHTRVAHTFKVRVFCFTVKMAKLWFEDRQWQSLEEIAQEQGNLEEGMGGDVKRCSC